MFFLFFLSNNKHWLIMKLLLLADIMKWISDRNEKGTKFSLPFSKQDVCIFLWFMPHGWYLLSFIVALPVTKRAYIPGRSARWTDFTSLQHNSAFPIPVLFMRRVCRGLSLRLWQTPLCRIVREPCAQNGFFMLLNDNGYFTLICCKMDWRDPEWPLVGLQRLASSKSDRNKG